MTTQEFREYLSREQAKLRWIDGAIESVDALAASDKELAQAAAARDKALADRDKALADIEARKERDAKAAERERATLQAALAKLQREATQAQQHAQANLELLTAQTRMAERELVEAAATLETYRTAKRAEEHDTQARIDALLTLERETRERLTAALGR